jgi:hypothetical protein
VLTAKSLCREFNFDHLILDNMRKIKNLIHDFFNIDGRTKVLEFESDTTACKNTFDKYKRKIKEHYEA